VNNIITRVKIFDKIDHKCYFLIGFFFLSKGREKWDFSHGHSEKETFENL